jgi:hypothetical protein
MTTESRELYCYSVHTDIFEQSKQRVRSFQRLNENGLFHLAHLIAFLCANRYVKEYCEKRTPVDSIFSGRDLFDAAIKIESDLVD